jgi:hypothetical protein
MLRADLTKDREPVLVVNASNAMQRESQFRRKAMDFSTYTLLLFAHVLLFAYWLGADWGVFVNGRRVADETLSRQERLRFLVASVEIDVLPRSAIVLVIAVGFTLAWMGGFSALGVDFLVPWWLLSAGWLALVWLTGYLLKPGPLKSRLDGIHIWLRHVVTVTLLILGVSALATGWPVGDAWLGLKLLLVGVLLTGGSILRIIVAGWVRELTAPDGSTEQLAAAGTIAGNYRLTRRVVFFFWGTTISIAFLGVTKPF